MAVLWYLHANKISCEFSLGKFLESMDSMVVGTLFTGSEVPLQMLEARERPIAGTTFERSFLFFRVLHHDHAKNIESSMQA